MKKQTVTINEVAKLAGVSRATAGRVIGNYGTVSEKSRRRVQEAIEQLNYSPNMIAQGLRRNSTKTIAVILGNIKNNYCNALVYAVEKEAQKAGYSVIICNTRENIQREIMHIQNMRNRHVDGIILMSALTTDEQIREEYRELYEGEFPMVFVDRKIPGLSREAIMSNNVEASYEATSHLLKLGHRNIGVIATADYSTIRERIRGHEMALNEYGVDLNWDLIATTNNPDQDEAQMATGRLLDEHPEITAIYILNNSLSVGVLLELKKRGLRVREDISLLTWDDELLNQLYDLTTVVQSIDEIGRVACSRLCDLMQGGCEGQHGNTERIKAQILYRNSCRNINDR